MGHSLQRDEACRRLQVYLHCRCVQLCDYLSHPYSGVAQGSAVYGD